MNEKELGRALLHGQTSIDVAELTRRVLRRDRQRLWLLGTLCVLAWMLVVMLPWATVLPMLDKVTRHLTEMNGNPVPAGAEHLREQSALVLQVVHQGTLATFFGSVGTMFVAALSTVAFVMTSRRATLRQVNASLGLISDQLKAFASK
jgi:hypothetical protein